MHIILTIVAGLALLAMFGFVGSLLSGATGIAAASKLFLPIWFLAAALNMWFGVARAGYSVRDETPIFLLVFAVPAMIAAYVWWKFSD